MGCSCCCHGKKPTRDVLASSLCKVPGWELEVTWSDDATHITEWGLAGPKGIRLGPFRDPNQAWEMAARLHLGEAG